MAIRVEMTRREGCIGFASIGLLALLAISPRMAAAQNTAAKCWEASGTVTARQCLSLLLTRENKRLEALEDSLARALDTLPALQIRSAGVAWRQYRLSECETVFLSYAPGILAPVYNIDCLLKVTIARRRFLRATFSPQLAR